MSSIRLFEAIRAGDLQITRNLLEGKEGVDVDTIRAQREREYEACRRGAMEIAEVLLANGANVNTKMMRRQIGHTALHAACEHGSPLLVQMLLNHGARINASNGDGKTPLSRACSKFRIDVIEVLLANNADRSIKDDSGNEPAALLEGHSEVFESYDKWPLTTSGVTQPTAARRENGGVMVNLNPRLSQHQHTLALKTLLLVRRLPAHEVALEILGFLTPAAVERIFLPT